MKEKTVEFQSGGMQIFYNQSQFVIENYVGNPHDQKSREAKEDKKHHHSLKYQSLFARCNQCGVLADWKRMITVRYGLISSDRSDYCLHCFKDRYDKIKIKIYLKLSKFNYFYQKLVNYERYINIYKKYYLKLKEPFVDSEWDNKKNNYEWCSVCNPKK